jgi:cell wall-associated NlpC family hydrolase
MAEGYVLYSTPEYTDLLGKRFEYGGRGPDSFDCYGIAVELYRRAGLTLPDYTSTDSPEGQGFGFAHGAENHFDVVNGDLHPLDIILFQVVPRFITHCGVYVGHGRFVHIMQRTSVACEELASPVWLHRNRGVYRFRGAL